SLLFHARSRRGRWRNDFLPFLGAIPPLPALKEPPSSREPIFLGPAPPPRDVPFHRVLDCRRSLREPGERPLPLEKLAEVLYRAARVTYARSASPELGHHYDVAARPYPCAGACYELELYAAVHRCDSLEPALYWYDPAGHALRRAGENPRALEALLAEASASAGGKHLPDCLLVITARFPRVLWKYGGLGYSLILKDVGVLMQTVSLCAEAAGLGACILGCGDSLVMADAAGLDPDAETSVGEIILWGEQRGEPLRAGCVAAG
ncbi:MAG TPA: SagB family peptide dehydrogenase, partial [Verrucomicrobiae bacterium]|nr:SagB family peptide dehydrogenase [Verrucomicrobiae bacterium]